MQRPEWKLVFPQQRDNQLFGLITGAARERARAHAAAPLTETSSQADLFGIFYS